MDWLFVFSQAFTDGHIKGERERGGGRERERVRESNDLHGVGAMNM